MDVAGRDGPWRADPTIDSAVSMRQISAQKVRMLVPQIRQPADVEAESQFRSR